MSPDVTTLRRVCSAELGRALAHYQRGDLRRARSAAAALVAELAAAGLLDSERG